MALYYDLPVFKEVYQLILKNRTQERQVTQDKTESSLSVRPPFINDVTVHLIRPQIDIMEITSEKELDFNSEFRKYLYYKSSRNELCIDNWSIEWHWL